jgi:TATA-binding protein-associated factor Taf7
VIGSKSKASGKGSGKGKERAVTPVESDKEEEEEIEEIEEIEEEQEEQEEQEEVEKQKPGLLSSLKSSIKRKVADRSPEAVVAGGSKQKASRPSIRQRLVSKIVIIEPSLI